MAHFSIRSGDSHLHIQCQPQKLGYKYFMTMTITGWWRRLALASKKGSLYSIALWVPSPTGTPVTPYLKSPLKKNKVLKVSIMNVQKQKDGFNCGLFAIANATALTFKLNPSEFVYDQSDLRAHFLLCCRNRIIEPFPSIQSRKSRNWRPSSFYRCPLFCNCRMPFSEDDIGFPDRSEQSLNAKAARIGIISIAKKYLRMLSLTSAANGAVPIVCRLNVFTLPLMKIHLLPYNSFNIQSSNKQ